MYRRRRRPSTVLQYGIEATAPYVLRHQRTSIYVDGALYRSLGAMANESPTSNAEYAIRVDTCADGSTPGFWLRATNHIEFEVEIFVQYAAPEAHAADAHDADDVDFLAGDVGGGYKVVGTEAWTTWTDATTTAETREQDHLPTTGEAQGSGPAALPILKEAIYKHLRTTTKQRLAASVSWDPSAQCVRCNLDGGRCYSLWRADLNMLPDARDKMY